MMDNIVQRSRNVLKFIALVAILVVVNLFVARLEIQWDMTEANIYSLSERSLETARNIESPTTIYFFHTPQTAQGPFKTERLRTLLRQYESASENITFEEIDHTQNPGMAREHGIRQNNAILIESGNRTKKISRYDMMKISGRRRRKQKFRGESAITSSLLKLSSATNRTVYFGTGFGEFTHQSARSRTVSEWSSSLEEEGYAIKSINPVTDSLPDTSELIVLLDPKENYSKGVISTYKQWYEKGGNLIVAASPASVPSMNSIVGSAWMNFEDLQIVDPSRKVQSLRSMVNPFIFAPKLKDHPSLSSLKEQGFAVQMGRSAPVLTTTNSDTAEVLLETSNEACAKPLTGAQVTGKCDPGKDKMGPFSVGLVADELEDHGKLFAFGSATIFSNRLLSRTPGNENFAVNIVNWIFDRDVSLGISATPSDYNQVTVTAQQSYLIQILSLILLPFLIIVWGGWVWWNRKNR